MMVYIAEGEAISDVVAKPLRLRRRYVANGAVMEVYEAKYGGKRVVVKVVRRP
ncbi:hypothetical protein [Pyrobaculum sp.]|uniref:hypothetical protein n=1 Tax=Pyrobaculum sp. TaxID=2004705 RepID=UPI003169E606